MTKTMAECPNHEGSFNCTPFCSVCEGEQEYPWTPFRKCNDCDTDVEHDVWFEELGMCLECSNAYWSHDNESEEL